MWEQLAYFTERLHRLPGHADLPTAQLLGAIFPHLHYVWIYRRDIVRQAVSLSRATQTGIWNDVGRERRPVPDPVFDCAAIDRMVHEIGAHNQNWRDFFDDNGIVPYTVTYERLEQDPAGVGSEILRYLGVSTARSGVFAPQRLRKQADALSDEWVERYHATRAGRTFVVAE